MENPLACGYDTLSSSCKGEKTQNRSLKVE